MTLSNCLKEAGDTISKEEKAALRKKVKSIRNSAGKTDTGTLSMPLGEANIIAVEETLAALRLKQANVMALAVAKASAAGDVLGSRESDPETDSEAPSLDSLGSNFTEAEAEEKNARVLAVLRKNTAMSESLDSGKLRVVHSTQRDALGDGWTMAFDEKNGMRGAYKKSTGQAVIFSDRVEADIGAVAVGYHEMLHAAEGYAEESGSARFDMLMGDQRSALYRRLNLLRQFGNPREKKVLQDAYELFVNSGDSTGDLAKQESEWMAYAIQAIVESKAEKGSIAKWAGDARLAVQQTLRKLLRIKVTADNLSMREFASLAELAIRETANSAMAETRQAAEDTRAEDRQAAEDKEVEARQAAEDKEVEDRQAAEDKEVEERDAKRTAKEADLRAKGKKAQEAAAAKEARDAERQAEKKAKADERQADKKAKDDKRQADKKAKADEKANKKRRQKEKAPSRTVEDKRNEILERQKKEEKSTRTYLQSVREMLQEAEEKTPKFGTKEYGERLRRVEDLKELEKKYLADQAASDAKFQQELDGVRSDAEIDEDERGLTRRRFMRNIMSLAVTAAVVGDGTVTRRTLEELSRPEPTLERGKYRPISDAIRQPLSEKTLQAIRDNDFVAALESAKESMPQEVKFLIDEIMSLLPDPSSYDVELGGYNEIKGGSYRFPSFANGNTLQKGLLTIYEGNEQGNDVDTLLHEAMHLVINARYSTLFAAAKGSTYDRTGLTRPQAEEAIAQFRNLHREFRKEVAKLAAEAGGIENLSVPMQIAGADGGIDEFFIRATTDPAFQLELYNIDYNGKTLLQRFKDWVKISLFGSKSGNTPTWLDAAILGITDVLNKSQLDAADFSTTLGIESYNKGARERNQARKDKAANADSSDGSDILGSRAVRTARATEMGFDTDTVYYHGTKTTTINKKGFRGNTPNVAAHLTTDSKTAESFAEVFGGWATSPDDAPTIYPVYIKVENTFDINKPSHRKILGLTPAASRDYSTLEGGAEDIKAAGFDSYWDFETDWDARSKKYTNIAVFDSANIRSVNAEFDGNSFDSSDILASRTALGQESRGTEKWTAATAKFGKEGMTKEARDARAEEQGFDMEVFSGSTFDIVAFDGDRARPDGDWGKASYASTSIEDVNENYAGIGPDLTARIELEAENIAQVMDYNDFERDQILEQASIPLEEYSGDMDAAHWKIASDRLLGPAKKGVVYPLKIKTGNYAVVDSGPGRNPDGRSQSFIYGKDFTEDARDELNRDDYEDEDAFDDALVEYADELSADSDESLYAKIQDALRDTDLYISPDSIGEVMEALQDDITDNALVVTEIDSAIRSLGALENDSGEMISPGEISSQVLKNLGFDGVLDYTVNTKFGTARRYGGSMDGVDSDTVHVVTFPGRESNIRSAYAAFDPDNSDSSDILASRKAPIGKTGRPYQAVRPNKVKGGEDRVQTSLPSGMKNKVPYYITGAPEEYSIGVDRILSVEKVAKTQKKTIEGYDFFTPSRSDLTAEETINEFKQFMVKNLIWLHNQMDPNLRETARKWYDGARKNVDIWSARYGLESRQVAAVIANLSPQKDWFMNMSLAERIMDIHTYRQDATADKDMDKAFNRVVMRDDKGKLIIVSKNPRKGESDKVAQTREYREIWGLIKNAKLSDVRSLVSERDGNLAVSIWVRMYDEAKHSRQYRMMKPTGEIIGLAMNDDGVTPSSVAWGSFTEIAKAMRVLQDGSLESVSMSLGGAHKVRNFYNNIIAPNSNLGEVTIDTHAMAAAVFKPLSAKSYEVAHVFGGTPVKGLRGIPEGVERAGAGSSKSNGIGGIYGIVADAYREAAAELGLLPRELQSITWEEIRVIYPKKFKDTESVNLLKINALWKQFAEGKMTLAKVRKEAYGLAKTKGDVPGWASRSDSGRNDRKANGTYSRDVYDDGVPRQVGGRDTGASNRSRGDVKPTRRASARGRAGQLDSDILGSRRNDTEQSGLEGLADLLGSIDSEGRGGRLPTTANTQNRFQRMISQRPSLLSLLPRRALAEIIPEEMPTAAKVIRQAEQMDADRNQILSDAGEVLNIWHRWARKNRKMASKLHTLMHDTTLVGYDPSAPYKSILTEKEYFKEKTRLSTKMRSAGTADQRLRYSGLLKALEQKRADEVTRKNAQAGLDSRYSALSKEAKDLYNRVRDEYGRQRSAMHKELADRIERAEMSETVRTAMADKLRIAFESNEVRGPYFPLSRFGEHFVVLKSVVDGKEVTEEFRIFETNEQALQYQNDMEKKHPTWISKKGVKDEEQSSFQEVDPEYASAVTGLIQNADGIGRKEQFELADAVWQLYLQTLPEMSIRKQSIHRGKVKGWDEDAMRAYSSIALHHAHHITKLRHGDVIRGLLVRAKEESNSLKDSAFAGRLLREIEDGVDWAMNPTNKPWASTLTSLGFIYQLGVSPAAALINTFQTPMVGIPVIGARYGYSKTAAAFAKATNEFSGVIAANIAVRAKDKTVFLENDMKVHWSDSLKGVELEFYQEMVRRSLFEKTRAHDLAGISDEGMNRSMMGRVVVDRISASFHNAEVFNREVTAMVAFRMAIAGGQNYNVALDYAYNVTLDVHFDYSNAGRPRILRLPAAKVIGQYKQYALNMSFRVLRDAYVAVNLSDETDPVVKREMVNRSLASVAISMLFSGIQGVFVYSVVKTIWNLLEDLFGDEDEPKDFEGELREGVYLMINDAVKDEKLASLLGQIVVDGPTDVLVGGSVGLRVAPDILRLFIQPQDNGKEGREQLAHFGLQMAGPVLGGVLGMFMDAKELLKEGEYWKGAEKVVPKFVRDVSKSVRYNLEGATNSENLPLIEADEFNGWELALQTLGFSPTELQLQYTRNRIEMTKLRKLGDRRDALMKQARKDINGGGGLSGETIAAIRRFSVKNPTMQVTSDNIRNSVTAKAIRAAMNEGGQQQDGKGPQPYQF